MKVRYVIIFFVISFLICNIWFYFLTVYPKKGFSVTVNDQELNFYIQDRYQYTAFPLFVHIRGWQDERITPNQGTYTNEMLLDHPLLKVQIFTCYNRHTHKKIGCGNRYVDPQDQPVQKEQAIAPSKMTILYKDKTLYQGAYQEDLQTIIQEEGRYYFILDYHYHDGWNEKYQTKILFNIKFVGVDYE